MDTINLRALAEVDACQESGFFPFFSETRSMMRESVLTEKYLTRFSIYHDNQEGKVRILMTLIIDA